ncbi:MAG TPA: polysaccharide biosynthesis tyrosine autokinase [Oligoflexia bacterium]|nr:polysaccharide biosynthesis tyrosine autokinase [Oligoflexia bacterium]HMP48302.1 polysaccharide biosynthesis tyrosine autokinase [Oligoflexia bacterium]
MRPENHQTNSNEVSTVFARPGTGTRSNPLNPSIEIDIGSSSSGFSEEHPLHKYFRILLSKRKMILGCTILVVTLSTIYSLLATPLYLAETELSIGTYSPTIHGTSLEESLAKQTEKQDYLETQIKLLTRLTLADKVLSDPVIGTQIKDYLKERKGIMSFLSGILESILPQTENDNQAGESAGTNYKHSIAQLNSYLSLVKIEAVKRTFLVKVKAVTAKPKLSADIANAHSRHFIDLAKNEKQNSALSSLFFLRQQAEELAGKVSIVEQQLAQYSEENAIVSLNQGDNIVNKKLSELNQLLTEATGKRIKSEAAFNEANSGGALTSTGADGKGLEDLRLRLRDAEASYAKLGEKFKPGYPRMIQLRAEIESLRNNINQQTKIIVSSAEAQYKADLAAEEELSRELELQKSQTFDLSRKMVKFNTMKREFESLKDLHQSVLRQLKEAQISSESETNNIRITDSAATPTSHSSPKRLLNFLIALFLGPLLGFGLALALDSMDRTLETSDELKRTLQIPSLGVIPSFDSEGTIRDPASMQSSYLRELPDIVRKSNNSTERIGESSDSSLPATRSDTGLSSLVTIDAPFSVTSEAYRAVRTSLLLSSADTPPRVVLVTSSRKGEGKTTTSSNLAVTIAGSVKSALVIDCDLRRSSLNKHFEVPDKAPGLVELLTDQCSISEAIFPTKHENLSIMPAGIKPPNPAELLGSRKLIDLIETLKERFEFILIDSPPVLPVTDAVILSRIVDGVILVVRGHQTDQGVAKEARNRITQVGGKILGAILNGVDIARGQHYYYYRDAYSEYYAEDTDSPRKKGNMKFWG